MFIMATMHEHPFHNEQWETFETTVSLSTVCLLLFNQLVLDINVITFTLMSRDR